MSDRQGGEAAEVETVARIISPGDHAKALRLAEDIVAALAAVRSSGSEGGEAAEAEAVAQVFANASVEPVDDWHRRAALEAITALDAVRSSGSGESRLMKGPGGVYYPSARSSGSAAQDHEDCPECGVAAGVRHRDGCFFLTGDPADQRSPQVEVGPGRRPFDPSKVAPQSGSAAQNHEWGVPAGSQDAPTMGATNILPDPPVFQARSPQDEDHEAREGVEFQEEIGPAARQRSGPGTQEGRS